MKDAGQRPSSERGERSPESHAGRAEVSGAPSQAALDAFCEYLRLLELDQETAFDEFCARRPTEEADLRRLFAEYERVTAILERLAPAASFSDRLRARYGASVDPGIALSADAEEGAREGTTTGSKGSRRRGSGTGGVFERLAAMRPVTGRYEPRGEIARGGMGAILKVWDRELRRMLAMKVVLAKRGAEPTDSDAEVGERRLSRFLEEAQITGQLDHPGIVPVHDLGIDSKGRVYFTMQLIEGRDLREVFELARLEREGWTRNRVLSAIVRVCEAAAYAHDKGVVHRDLKPANVMVGRFGETYVMDWGLAKVMGREDAHDLRLAALGGERPRVVTDRSTATVDDEADSPLRTMDGDVVGTPAYMSPEQALGRLESVGPLSDVYSVGAMLYHLLSGHMPYEPLGERVPATTVLEAVRSGPPWPLQKLDPSCDAELVAICAKAMAREPQDRYPDMMAFAEDLRAFLEGRGVRAYETGALYEFRKLIARNRGISAALGALVLLVVVSVGVFIRQQQVSIERISTAHDLAEKRRKETDEAKLELERNADKLRVESERANNAKQDALEKKALAEENWQQALENAKMTRRQNYRAQILAADYSLQLEQVAAAKASLAATEADLRDWEWRHLKLATEGWTREILRIDRGLADVAANADGSQLVCIGLDFQVRVVDPLTGKVAHSMQTAPFGGWSDADPYRLRVALSPNAGLGLAASHGDSILVFNALTGAPLGPLFHKGPKSALGFSGDGLRMVSASDAGTAVVWENTTVSIRQMTALAGHDGGVSSAALSPDGRRVVTGGADGTVRFWDAAKGLELHRLAGDGTRAATAVAWAPQPARGEQLVAIGYEDGSIALCEAQGASLRGVLHGHTGAVRALVFGDGGRSLHSGGDDMTVRTWRSASGLEERVFRGHDRAVTALALPAGGRELVSSSLDGSLRAWDLDWDPAVTTLATRGPLLGLGFAADDESIVTAPARGGPRAWDAVTGEPLFVYESPADVVGEPPAALDQALAVSADGRFVATAGMDRRVRIRRFESGAIVAELEGPHRRVRSLALSHDAAQVAAGASDGSVWIWSWRESKKPRVLDAHRREVLGMAFAPRGAELATVGRDHILRLWRSDTGEQVAIWPEAHELAINDVTFSADGELLFTASSDGRARAWRRDSRLPVATLEGKESALTAVAASPDGRRVVTGSADGELAMWDALTGDPLLALRGHAGGIVDVVFSHDGSRIASCSSDEASGRAELRIWETNPAAPRHAARARERELATRAEAVVELLYLKLLWPARVLDALATELAGHEPELREAVERMARLRAHDPDFLARTCSQLLLQPDASVEDRSRALETARRVALLCGYDAESLSVLGAAEVRAGRAEEGLRDLREAAKRRERAGALVRARDGLFEALAHLDQARHEDARAALAPTREVLANLKQVDDAELEPLLSLEPLLREVELSLGAAGSGGGSGGSR